MIVLRILLSTRILKFENLCINLSQISLTSNIGIEYFQHMFWQESFAIILNVALAKRKIYHILTLYFVLHETSYLKMKKMLLLSLS